MTKKKPTTRPGLTRYQLARALHVSLTTVDRLPPAGLKPVGMRNLAKLYRLLFSP